MPGVDTKSGPLYECRFFIGLPASIFIVMTLSDGALLAGAILSVIGLFRTLISLYEWRRDKKLFGTGARAEGVITEAVTYPNDDSLNIGQYRFIADFKTDRGITQFAKSRFASSSRDKFLNTRVTIIYNPEKPEESRFETDISAVRDVYENLILLVLGVVLILIG